MRLRSNAASGLSAMSPSETPRRSAPMVGRGGAACYAAPVNEPRSCVRCGNPVDGPPSRRATALRCRACVRLCTGCGAPVVLPNKICDACHPKCERCGSFLAARGLGPKNTRCPECIWLCRGCDAPTEVNPSTGAPHRWCLTCSTTCPDCGAPSDPARLRKHTGQRGSDGPRTRVGRRRCSPCVRLSKREVEAKARGRLGNRCARCAIEYPLQWDHVNNDPKKPASGPRRYAGFALEFTEIRKIALTGQSDRLQLLCPNCNTLKALDRAEYDRPPAYGPLRRSAGGGEWTC